MDGNERRRKIVEFMLSEDVPVAGKKLAELPIRTRQDVYDFVQKVKIRETVPLSRLTNEIHAHTVKTDAKEILDKIQMQLSSKNYLLDK